MELCVINRWGDAERSTEVLRGEHAAWARFAALRALLAVLAPVVTFIARLAASRAYTTIPLMRAERAPERALKLLCMLLRWEHQTYLTEADRFLKRQCLGALPRLLDDKVCYRLPPLRQSSRAALGCITPYA